MNVNPSFPVEAEGTTHQSLFMAWLRKRRWFVVCVIVPTVLATLYFGFFASDIYVSESRFVIKSADQKRSQVSTLANLIQTTGLSGGQEQTTEILAYVRSRDALKALEKGIDIRNRFSSLDGDLLSRFPQPLGNNSFEDLFRYYTKMVDAHLDNESGTAIIKVRAFTPGDAYEINKRLLDISETLVNRLNARAQSKGITEASLQVELATERARAARAALTQFRNGQAVIDPSKQAVGVIEISNTMIAQRALLQAQLDLTRRLAPANPSIPALRDRIAAISTQIASQDSRVVGTGNGIASKLGGYENLLVEQEFATQSMIAANAALVQARAEAQRQQFYLERVVDPNMPDMPALPKRILSIVIVAAAATALYFIGWMLVAGIVEHAPDE